MSKERKLLETFKMSKERKLLEREEVIYLLEKKIEDSRYSLKRARSPQSKRGYAWAVNFCKSLKYWVEKSKENENNQ